MKFYKTIFFQGVGIALLIGQAFIGFYGIIGISWLLVYLRDSFIRGGDSYSWAFTFSPHRDYFKSMRHIASLCKWCTDIRRLNLQTERQAS